MKERIIEITGIFFITILLAECVLRILGFEHYRQETYCIQATPPASLISHSTYGMALNPGSYKILINDSLEYTCQHLPDSTRNTGHKNKTTLPEIHLYGCSFTYGMGVDDEESFAYLLQEKISDYAIINKGVPAYGNLQGYLQYLEEIKKGKDIDMAIAFYAPFHEERNVMNPSFRSQMHYGLEVLGILAKEKGRFPHARLNDGNLEIGYLDSEELYRPIPLRDYSALANAIQEIINGYQSLGMDGTKATITIFEHWARLCHENGTEFIVATLLDDAPSLEMNDILKKKGIRTLPLGLDIMNDKQYNNLPHDSHPNALSHRIYAERLFHYLSPESFH